MSNAAFANTLSLTRKETAAWGESDKGREHFMAKAQRMATAAGVSVQVLDYRRVVLATVDPGTPAPLAPIDDDGGPMTFGP